MELSNVEKSAPKLDAGERLSEPLFAAEHARILVTVGRGRVLERRDRDACVGPRRRREPAARTRRR